VPSLRAGTSREGSTASSGRRPRQARARGVPGPATSLRRLELLALEEARAARQVVPEGRDSDFVG
jgi:hypothetical protein